jgi:hypothetical protein
VATEAIQSEASRASTVFILCLYKNLRIWKDRTY